MFSALSPSREVVIKRRIWSAFNAVCALEMGISCQNVQAPLLRASVGFRRLRFALAAESPWPKPRDVVQL